MHFTILFPPMYHLPRLSQGRTQGRPKCAKNVLKWWTFELMGWITGKWLKIDRYMLWCVWQALNPLSIHVTFTAIVPGAYPKGGQNVQKMTHIPLAIANLLVYRLYSLPVIQSKSVHVVKALTLKLRKTKLFPRHHTNSCVKEMNR